MLENDPVRSRNGWHTYGRKYNRIALAASIGARSARKHHNYDHRP